ncbi:MAG: M48 family peptidase [Betaproteobacteria bacterium]|jgi:predicted Zn-dependent protease|nr:M48 family peptidase [Betaproteobacteria bacterium]NBT67191.1 M48 family peptidase [Betaproteobacteria bacterium]
MNRRQLLHRCAFCMAGVGLLPNLANAREGVEVGKSSAFAKFVPAEELEGSARQQYQQLLQQANKQNALASETNPQVIRLREIAQKIIPHSYEWNPRAKTWKWEINLIGSNQVNAFCMPGGKIAFFSGILKKLELTDDEVAMVMGHEVAHALREHARERMGKGIATEGASRIGGAIISGLFGIDPRLTDMVARGGANLLTLKFSREDETEADLVGMELGARAGFDPRAGISLWNKMSANNTNAPPEWMSTHPAGSSRIQEMQANMDKVLPLFQKATQGQMIKQ